MLIVCLRWPALVYLRYCSVLLLGVYLHRQNTTQETREGVETLGCGDFGNEVVDCNDIVVDMYNQGSLAQ